MSNKYDQAYLPIVKETVTLMEYYATVYKQIPKWAKHGSTVPAMTNAMQELLRYLVSAGKMQDKKPLLLEADVRLDCLRLYLRLSFKTKLITPKQYEQMSIHTTKIGNQLGSWLRSLDSTK